MLIFLPNFVWLVRHDFISYHFLQHIHQRDVGEGRADGFLKDQFLLCVNLFATPSGVAGLVLFLRDARYRMLAWMYLIPFALFWIAKGRVYYVAGAYPDAAGHGRSGRRTLAYAASEVGAAKLSRPSSLPDWPCGARTSAPLIVPFCAAARCATLLSGTTATCARNLAGMNWSRRLPGFAIPFPPDQQASLGILVGNYGEQGAIEMLGPAYHLPPPISMTNSAWLRGYPDAAANDADCARVLRGRALIATSPDCRLAGHNGNSLGIRNEESKYHPDIFVCGPPRQTLAGVLEEQPEVRLICVESQRMRLLRLSQ